MAEITTVVKIAGDALDFIRSMGRAKEATEKTTASIGQSFGELRKATNAAERNYKDFAARLGPNSPEAKQALKGLSDLKEKINEINSTAANAGKSGGGVFSDMKSNLLGVAAGFATVDGAARLASAAFSTVKDVMMMTDTGALEVEAKTAGVTAAFVALKDRAADLVMGTRPVTEAFTGLGTQMKYAADSADNYARAMDAIEDRNSAFIAQEARMRNEIAKLQFAAKDQTKSEGERKQALEKSLSLEREIVDFKQNQAKKAYDEEVKKIAARFFISDKVIKKIIEGDQKATDSLVANNTVAAKAWDKLYGAGGEGQKLSQLYAGYINLDTEFFEQNKRTQSQLTGFEQSGAKAVETATERKIKAWEKQKKSQSELIGLASQALNNLAGGIDGPGRKNGKYQSDIVSNGFKIPGMGATSSMQAIQQGGIPATTANMNNSPLENWETALKDIQPLIAQFSSNIGSMMAGVGDIVSQAANGFKEGWKGALGSIGQMAQGAIGFVAELFTSSNNKKLEQLDQQTAAERKNIETSMMSEEQKREAMDRLDKQSEKKRKVLMREQAKDQKMASLMQAAVAGSLAIIQAFASGPGIGMVLGLVMTGLVAAQLASIVAQPLPALASGGLAYAPTMALIGDNPNARINPEVIAPLDKLKSLLGIGEGEVGGSLTARVSGDDLLFVMNRAQISKNRRY